MSGPTMHMPIYWGDYLKDTGHLSAAEHGAYLLLIGHYWTTGAPLPDDEAALRRIARMEAREWKASRGTLRAFFQVADGVWRHKRVEAEMTRAKAVYQKRVDAANKRWAEKQTASGAPSKTDADGHAYASSGASPNADASDHARHEQPQPQPHLLTEKKATQLGPELPAAPEDAQAEVRRATDLIRAFDAAIVAVWGADQARPFPTGTDSGTALRWLRAGVTPELVASVAEPRFRRMASQRKAHPGSLAFLDGAITDTLAEAARQGLPPPGAKPDPDREAAARQYLDALDRWHDDGMQGPSPKPEDFGLKAAAA